MANVLSLLFVYTWREICFFQAVGWQFPYLPFLQKCFLYAAHCHITIILLHSLLKKWQYLKRIHWLQHINLYIPISFSGVIFLYTGYVLGNYVDTVVGQLLGSQVNFYVQYFSYFRESFQSFFIQNILCYLPTFISIYYWSFTNTHFSQFYKIICKNFRKNSVKISYNTSMCQKDLITVLSVADAHYRQQHVTAWWKKEWKKERKTNYYDMAVKLRFL